MNIDTLLSFWEALPLLFIFATYMLYTYNIMKPAWIYHNIM